MPTPARTAGTSTSIGSHIAGAMFLAGVIAAVVVLGPIYAVGSLVRRITSHGAAGLPVIRPTATQR